VTPATNSSVASASGSFYDDELGVSIALPIHWEVAKKNRVLFFAENTVYLDYYAESRTDVVLPEHGFKAQLLTERVLRTPTQSEQDILKTGLGREAAPLVAEAFLTINDLPAYRAFRQLPAGATALDSTVEITTTTVEYAYLSGDRLYHFYVDITEPDPAAVIEAFDAAARSFTIEPVR
jgi:hypothetical protein